MRLPVPSLPHMVAALLEMEDGAVGPATLALRSDALAQGLPHAALSNYLYAVAELASEWKRWLTQFPPEEIVSVPTIDAAALPSLQALGYLYEVESQNPGRLTKLFRQAWANMTPGIAASHRQLVLDAAQRLNLRCRPRLASQSIDVKLSGAA